MPTKQAADVNKFAIPNPATPDDPTPCARSRFKLNREEKKKYNERVRENQARFALILGGGAPNMALMAGALAAFEEEGVRFDVVSTSGAGAVIGLLWQAPKDLSPLDALRNVTNLSVADPIYGVFPVNYKVFSRPGFLAHLWRSLLAANPWVQAMGTDLGKSDWEKLFRDGLRFLWASAVPPFEPTLASLGLCAPAPFIETVVDFSKVRDIEPYFYLNAYNISTREMCDFPKEIIDVDHFRASLAFPLIYPPYPLKNKQGQEEYYFEGAVVDCLNFKDLTEKHTGLETIVVLDVLGSDSLIRQPRNLYDAWVLSMVVPLVETAKDDLRVFAWKYNYGWRRDQGAKANLLRVCFDIPDELQDAVLDWSSSNAETLFDLGHRSASAFIANNRAMLAFNPPGAALT